MEMTEPCGKIIAWHVSEKSNVITLSRFAWRFESKEVADPELIWQTAKMNLKVDENRELEQSVACDRVIFCLEESKYIYEKFGHIQKQGLCGNRFRVEEIRKNTCKAKNESIGEVLCG